MQPWNRRGAHGAGPLLTAGLLVLTGCATGESEPVEENAPPPPAPRPHLIGSSERTTPPDLYFVEARGHFLAGHYEDAAYAYETYLEANSAPLAGPPGNAARSGWALWELALLHLLPDTPVQDREAGAKFLERLEEEHPGTVQAVQAAWVRETLGALEEAREVAARRAGVIEELEEKVEELEAMVEQLRRLHLDRRPRLPPPDTLSPDTLDGGGPPDTLDGGGSPP